MKYVFKKLRYKILIPLLDVMGNIVFFPMRLFKKGPPPNPERILVIRLDHIGDFVCTTPLFKNIKKKFPRAKITALINSSSKELAYRDPNIDKIITFSPAYLARNDKSSLLKGLMRVIKDVRALNFDLGIDPRGDLLSILIMWLGGVKYKVGYGITGGGFLLDRKGRYDKNSHVTDRNISLLKYAGINVSCSSPDVYFNEKDMAVVDSVIRDLGINMDRAIVLHPFAGARAREWSNENFQKLIDKLKSNGILVLLIGTGNDKDDYSNVTDMRGKLNLPQLAYFIKRAGYFIGLNSGPANIAAALNVPSVIISSGTNIIEHWIPNNSNVKFVYKYISCRPCERKVCPKDRHDCMDQITVEEVFDKFKEIHEGIF